MLEELSFNIAKVVDGEDVWYIRALDRTHIWSANNLEAVQKGRGSVYHIGQVRHRPYYKELDQWLSKRDWNRVYAAEKEW